MTYTQQEKEYYMSLALEQARLAFDKGEVPVGCVIVWEGRVVAKAHNTRETEKNALHHAEIKAIDTACRELGGWRLHKGDMFVTLEPCIMCAGAIASSRIRKVYWGAADLRAGGFGGITDIRELPITHKPMSEGGVLEAEASGLLKEFFAQLRKKLR